MSQKVTCPDNERVHPLARLDDGEQEFVLRFVLSSGSLKDMARSYAVSYPTIRAKLDALIARLEALRCGQPANPLGELLAGLVEKGEITPATARRVLDEHRKALKRI